MTEKINDNNSNNALDNIWVTKNVLGMAILRISYIIVSFNFTTLWGSYFTPIP